jgi:DeoR/GlpR family transcriptional regulator of sugar metabolism
MTERSGEAARERRDAIMSLLLEAERVSVRELTERFDVSMMTVHRDLDVLADRGVLRKVRGGATALPTALYESSLGFRLNEARDAKRAIAEHAAHRVKAGSSVALDDSTTTLAMVPYLVSIPQLTIVTYFASVIEEVARVTDSTLKLVVVGGTYHAKYHSFGGVLAQQHLEELQVDHSFVSVSAIDVDRGAFHQEPDQAVLKRTVVEIARHSTLLADASKFGKGALHRVVALDAFDCIVVDEGTPKSVLSALRAHRLPLETAAPARG